MPKKVIHLGQSYTVDLPVNELFLRFCNRIFQNKMQSLANISSCQHAKTPFPSNMEELVNEGYVESLTEDQQAKILADCRWLLIRSMLKVQRH